MHATSTSLVHARCLPVTTRTASLAGDTLLVAAASLQVQLGLIQAVAILLLCTYAQSVARSIQHASHPVLCSCEYVAYRWLIHGFICIQQLFGSSQESSGGSMQTELISCCNPRAQ
jgi:hypothetical protein